MNEAFPPLRPIADFPRRVTCFAPHPDDEVLGCGGALALHARRGDRVRIVVLSDGGGGLEGEAREALVAEREIESRAAAAALGIDGEVEFWRLYDGALAYTEELRELLAKELVADAPELIYAPSPLELHADHRAVARSLGSALEVLPTCRVHLYGVNRQVPATVLVDTTSVQDAKRTALGCFTSQSSVVDLAQRAEAFDRSYTVNVDDAGVACAEGFVVRKGVEVGTFASASEFLRQTLAEDAAAGEMRATAVISTWNKKDDVRENLRGLRSQLRPFHDIVVVDNASTDGTPDMIRAEFPEVRLIVMPNSAYGACETFNVGFASSRTELTAILDDDVVLPPDWLLKTTSRLDQEPATTAIVSTKILEPGMPESYKNSEALNTERYMSTFRGCASLARTQALREAGGYDERLFIYGNERDLTCRLLNLGYRVLQYPEAHANHKTPFGIKMGKRSLFYHARNAWLGMIKYAPLPDLLRAPVLVVKKVLLRSGDTETSGEITDATGTIGIQRAIKETPGAWFVLLRAGLSVLYNVPYCLKRREPVTAEDFELPIE
ncbi:MAG: glycosyltransferase [bacterium]|nr:glycosyltransferase [bacterium]